MIHAHQVEQFQIKILNFLNFEISKDTLILFDVLKNIHHISSNIDLLGSQLWNIFDIEHLSIPSLSFESVSVDEQT